MTLLEIDSLTVQYGSISAAREVDLHVDEGDVVGLIGPNGAGKTTLLGAVSGLLRPSSGRIRFDGRDVTGLAPDAMLRAGLALVPEHRRIFTELSVADNLRVGGVTVGSKQRSELMDEMVERFPVLKERFSTPAGFLSGGEAQQLAIARALMSNPKMVLMDEPSLGLAPSLVSVVFDLIDELRTAGRTMLVVEQNATRLLEIADRAYVMRTSEILTNGPASDLLERSDLFESYVGGEQE